MAAGEAVWFGFIVLLFVSAGLWRAGWERESAHASARWGTHSRLMPEQLNHNFRPIARNPRLVLTAFLANGTTSARSPITRRPQPMEERARQARRVLATTAFIVLLLDAPLLTVIYWLVNSEWDQLCDTRSARARRGGDGKGMRGSRERGCADRTCT